MRGILINAKANTVTEVETTGELADLYRLVECSLVQTVAVEATTFSATPHDLWVDEEGLLSDPEFFFVWDGNPIAGNGLLLGTSEDGDCIACDIPLDAIKQIVTFKRMQVDGFVNYDTTTDSPIGGPDTPTHVIAPVLSQRPDDAGGVDGDDDAGNHDAG